MTNEYLIPTYNLPKLEKKLTAIEKKCMKYDCYFRYKKGEPRMEEFEKTFVIYDTYGNPVGSKKRNVSVEVVPVEVEGIAKLNGWEYVGSIEPAGAGRNLVHAAFDKEVPQRFYTCPLTCEHCGKKQGRSKTFIVRNLESGEYKQVGRTCLRTYTDGFDAEFAAAMEEFADFEDAYGNGGDWIHNYSGPCSYPIVDALMCAIASIEKDGYIKDAAEWSNTTKGKVNKMLMMGDVPEENRAKAEKIYDWAKNIESNNGYLNNCKSLAIAGCVDAKQLGILVSMVPGFKRNADYEKERQEKERQRAEAEEARKAEAAKTTWAGEVGDKITFEVNTITNTTSFETAYGTTYVYKITDKQGHVYTWFASQGFFCTDEEAELVTTKMSATIKKLDEYKGEKQTIITRAKVVERHKFYRWKEHTALKVVDLSEVEKAKDLYEANEDARNFNSKEEVEAFAKEKGLNVDYGNAVQMSEFVFILYPDEYKSFFDERR